MRSLLLGLAISTSPAVAQVPPTYPTPTPPVYVYQPYVPSVYTPYYLTPVSPTYTPQYIYRTLPNSTLTPIAPDYAIQEQFGQISIRPTMPNSSLIDISKPSYVVK